MDDHLTTWQIMRKTYGFVIIRLLIVAGTIIPIYFVTIVMADFFFRLFGLEVEGIVYSVFWLSFALIGCTIGIGIFGVVRKTLLYYAKASHVIAITKLCVDDVDPSKPLLVQSWGDLRRRFLSVSLFGVADKLLQAGIDDIGKILMEQDIIPALSVKKGGKGVLGGIKNMGLKFVGSTVKMTLSYMDEIVLSYIFVRTRLNETYGEGEVDKRGRNRGAERKKRDGIKELFGYAVDGLCLYVRNCVPLLKSSFTSVLQVTVFGWVVTLATVAIMFGLISGGALPAIMVFIRLRLIFSVFMYVFLEPYETAVMISEFYGTMYEDTGDLNLEPVRAKLLASSVAFKKMVSKSMGRSEAEVDDKVSITKLLDADILDVAMKEIDSLTGGDGLTDGERNKMDENLAKVDVEIK